MALRLKIDPGEIDGETLSEAVGILRAGGVLAFPTETFYGLGADARIETAVEKIFRIKGRNFLNPLPLIVADQREIQGLAAEIPAEAVRLMQIFWPGPLTLIFRASSRVSSRLTGGTGKIGIRVSSHPVARALAAGIAGPLTATSANLSGGPECSSADAVTGTLGDLPDALIDGGPSPGGKGSTILDITLVPPRILRDGAVPRQLIMDALSQM